MQARRQSDAQDLTQSSLVQPQMVQIQVQRTLLLDQQADHHCSRDRLTDDRGQSYTRNAHVEPDHEHQVQPHVYQAGYSQADQRAAGITNCPQQGSAKVVQHSSRHTQKVDLQVQGRKLDHILRAGHQFQQPAGGQKTSCCQHNAAAQSQRDRGAHRVLHAALILCAKTPGSNYIGAQGQSYK